ncbi:Transposon TX1 protein, partial [Smittium culicis]
GDFNMDTPASIRLTAKLGAGLQLARVSNSKGSRYNKTSVGRMIDHVYYAGLNSRPNWCTANRFLDLSDHMPITAQWNIDSLEVPAKKLKINGKKILLDPEKFTSNNRFAVLADGNLALDELCEGLIENVWAQSARLCATGTPGEAIKTVLSKNALKKIKSRRKKFKSLIKNKCGQIDYVSAKSAANDAIKADRKASYEKKLRTIADNLMDNNPKEYWAYIKSCSGSTFHSVSNGPVYDSNKNLITETAEKLKIWTKHFGDLAKDISGNSRSPSKWQDMISDDSDYFIECDDSVNWYEIIQALKDTPNNKAPGADGVPSEVWKLVMNEKSPTSNLAILIKKIVNMMYDSGYIPKSMTTSVVVPVPKKGDMRDPDNYRGISLIPTIIKLLAKIVAAKLAAIDIKYKLIVKEQAGFRDFEECVAQATTLYEIVKRRKVKNLQTWICYIDYSKAYDRVPHMALIHKLRSLGIGGKLLNTISGLYYEPKLVVRIGDTVSEPSEYLCGVRQGCPASPILFDLFINDIFKDVIGVEVPGVPSRIPGLLFADDAVVLADSAENLQTSLDAITVWSDTWEMAVNASKCAIMAVNCDDPAELTLQRQ